MSAHAKVNESWWDYYVALANKQKTKPGDLAKRAGLNPSLLTRWKTGSQPSVDNLRKLAHITGTSIVDLLVAAGHLEPEEVRPNPLALVSISDPDNARTAIENDDTLSKRTKRHLLAILDVEEATQD